MKLFTRFLRVRVALLLITATTALGGCATTKDQPMASSKKREKPQAIHALTESYALSDDTTVDKAIIRRGAQVRGTDQNY